MARSSKNRTSRNYQNYNLGGREFNVFSRQHLPLSKYYKKQSIPLSEFEDRRRFHPEGKERPAKNFRAINVRFRVAGIPIAKAKRSEGRVWDARTEGYDPLPWRIGFERPERVLICARRKIRREVIHALGFAGGRGGKNFKIPRWTKNSSVTC